MIVDNSALIAIVLDEPDADELLNALAKGQPARISSANLLETYLVIDRLRNPRAPQLLDAILGRIDLVVESVTEAQVVIARDAFSRYGKGSGHLARLNFGDCFAYA